MHVLNKITAIVLIGTLLLPCPAGWTLERAPLSDKLAAPTRFPLSHNAQEADALKLGRLKMLMDKVSERLLAERKSGILGRKIDDIHHPAYFTEGGIAYIPSGKGQLIVVGDTHGDSMSTKQILRQTEFIDKVKRGEKVHIVFLGDYIDLGTNSVDNLLTILRLKKEYPDNVTLLKGNHEFIDENRIEAERAMANSGHIDENRLVDMLKEPDRSKRLMDAFRQFSLMLPVIAVTKNGIVLAHSGTPSLAMPGNETRCANGLLSVANPAYLPYDPNSPDNKSGGAMQWEIVWSFVNSKDPGQKDEARRYKDGSESYNRYWIGEISFNRFMDSIGGRIMIRGHDAFADRAAALFGDRLITVISTGGSSAECGEGYKSISPRYAIFDLSKKYEKIDPQESIVDLSHDNAGVAKTSPIFRYSALILNNVLQIADYLFEYRWPLKYLAASLAPDTESDRAFRQTGIDLSKVEFNDGIISLSCIGIDGKKHALKIALKNSPQANTLAGVAAAVSDKYTIKESPLSPDAKTQIQIKTRELKPGTNVTVWELDPKEYQPHILVADELDGKLYPVDRRINALYWKDGGRKQFISKAAARARVPLIATLKERFSRRERGRDIVGVTGNENLFYNAPIVTVAGDRVYYATDENIEGRDYPMYVVWPDNHVTIEERVRFKFLRDGQDPDIFIDGRRVEFKYATVVQLLRNENGFVHPDGTNGLAYFYDDVKHLFVLPKFGKEDHGIDGLMSEGVFFMADQITSDKDRIHRFFSDPDVRQQFKLTVALIDRNGNEIPGGWKVPPATLREKLLDLGYNAEDFSINEDTIDIRLKENGYPWHIVGVTANGRVKEIAVNSPYGARGVTLREAAELAEKEGLVRAGIIDQGTTVRLDVGGKSFANPTVDKDDAHGPRASSVIVYAKKTEGGERAGGEDAGVERLLGSTAALALRAKRQGQKLIIGLETDWIPGINERGGLQQQAIKPLIEEISSLGEKLRLLGIDNVEIIHENSAMLAGAIVDRAGKTGTGLSNVVVFASN